MESINTAGDLIFRNLTVMLPVSLILVKLLLVRLSGHKEHQWRSILSIPEDIVYIALGFIVSGISGTLRAFENAFASSNHAYLNVWLLGVVGALLCYLIHVIDQRWTTPNFQGWRACDDFLDNKITEKQAKKAAALGTGKLDFGKLFYWKFSLFLLGVVLELAIAGWWLWYIAEIIEHNSITKVTT